MKLGAPADVPDLRPDATKTGMEDSLVRFDTVDFRHDGGRPVLARLSRSRLQQRLHTTVLMVTHDIAEAFALAGRVGVLDAGELIAFDTPSRLLASEDSRVRLLIDAIPPLRASTEP